MISAVVAFKDTIHLKTPWLCLKKSVAFENISVVSSQISVAPRVGSVYQKSAEPSQGPKTTLFPTKLKEPPRGGILRSLHMKHSTFKLVDALRRHFRGDAISHISVALGVAESTIRDWIKKANHLGITAEVLRTTANTDIENSLRPRSWLREGCWEGDYEQLMRQKVALKCSLQHCYELYLTSVPEGEAPVPRATFYRRMKQVKDNPSATLERLTILNEYLPGQKAMIDYSGDSLEWYDRKDGNKKRANIFVGILCYSGLIYCQATATQRREDWLRAISSMFEFFNGVPEELWLDNSTTLVDKADKYNPKLNEVFKAFCDYHNTLGYAVAPGKPKHKALVENAVGLIQRNVLAELTRGKFFSIREINQAIEPLLKELNRRELTEFVGQSRQSRYESVEVHTLRALPMLRYDPDCQIVSRKVRSTNQIRIGNIRYNVPWGYVGQFLWVKINNSNKTLTFVRQDTGEELRQLPLRSCSDGPEPLSKAHLPEALKHQVEDKEELLARIQKEFGGDAYLLAQRLSASGGNSLVKRQLRGLISFARKYPVEQMQLIYAVLLKRSVVTFTHLQEAIAELNKKNGMNNCKRKIGHGGTLELANSSDSWGKKHFEERMREIGAEHHDK